MNVVRFTEAAPEAYESQVLTGPVQRWLPLGDSSHQVTMSYIDFPVGTHSKFHSHDGDQILVVVHGRGFVETEDSREEIAKGDVVHCPAGERHQHGAGPALPFGHLSIIVSNENTGRKTL